MLTSKPTLKINLNVVSSLQSHMKSQSTGTLFTVTIHKRIKQKKIYKTVNYNDLTSHCKHYFHLLVVKDDALNNKLNRLRNKLK